MCNTESEPIESCNPSGGCGSWLALIVVLFILLIIIGAVVGR
ncbi:MAG: YjcZ family sporulation protein [Sporolactobacillus sp.]